ncbi:UDP-glucose dehydrogenase family protein [Phocaeicola sp.]
MVITVFGLGFVGLTTALGFAEYGHTVYGVEVNEARLSTIRAGKLPFLEKGLDEALLRHLDNHFHPVSLSELDKVIPESDCVYYCVGTPYGKDGQADLTYLLAAIDQTLEQINDDRFRVLVVKSTIPPSTTESKIVPYVENKGYKVGTEIGIANNPEFLREGHCWDDFIYADRIVLGVSDFGSEEILRELYASVKVPVFCVSLNTGEFIKYLSNTLLATLISYSNEMSVIADTLGRIDVAQAFRILHMDKRWGGCNMASYAYPGCGYGGYCLPKDTNALYAVAKSSGFDAQILKNVISVNDNMPQFIAERIDKAVEGRKELKLAVLGLSFKPESDDVRDAPSAKIIRQLSLLGYTHICGYDPVANEEFKVHYQDLQITYYQDYDRILAEADVFIIATAWPEFKDIHSRTEKLVIDCRYFL